MIPSRRGYGVQEGRASRELTSNATIRRAGCKARTRCTASSTPQSGCAATAPFLTARVRRPAILRGHYHWHWARAVAFSFGGALA